MATLEISALRKRFGTIEVLKDIDIALEKGGFLVLVGPSGCGKSTLLNTIAGLEPISSGEIRIGDQVVNHLHPSKRDIAMVFQSYALYPNMSVAENIGFGMEMRGVAKPDRERLSRPSRKLCRSSICWTGAPANCRGDSGSALLWAARSFDGPVSFCSTSRSRTSMPSCE